MPNQLRQRTTIGLLASLISLFILWNAAPYAMADGQTISKALPTANLAVHQETKINRTVRSLLDTPNYPGMDNCLYTNFEQDKYEKSTKWLSRIPSWKTFGEIKRLDQRISLYPTDAEYHEERAKEYFIAGSLQRALADADSVLILNPFSHSAHIIKMLCFYQLNKPKEWS